jgi:hypothetical protein
MPFTPNFQRSQTRRRRANNGARKIVNQALKREHGFIVKTSLYDPPSYKANPLIVFKQRVTFRSVANSSVSFDINDILTSSTFREYKVLLVQAWSNSRVEGATVGLNDQLDLSVISKGETFKASDIAGRNHHAVCAIRPPQDDFSIKSIDDMTFTVSTGNVAAELVMDILLKVRLNLPSVDYTPTKVEFLEVPSHSFC